jgi:hypothetical protein
MYVDTQIQTMPQHAVTQPAVCRCCQQRCPSTQLQRPAVCCSYADMYGCVIVTRVNQVYSALTTSHISLTSVPCAGLLQPTSNCSNSTVPGIGFREYMHGQPVIESINSQQTRN